MAAPRVDRRLAAIMAVDVVHSLAGWSVWGVRRRLGVSDGSPHNGGQRRRRPRPNGRRKSERLERVWPPERAPQGVTAPTGTSFRDRRGQPLAGE